MKQAHETFLSAFDLNTIQDESVRTCISMLFNIIEELKRENTELRAEVQRLKDENARLKGEQGKPDIKPNTQAATSVNHSSEKERRTAPKDRKKKKKKGVLRIDREERLSMDPAVLPPDAICKGVEEFIVQDIVLASDTIRFLKEKYYSPSEGKTYLAPLPAGYDGHYGPGVRSLVLTLYFVCHMTEPKILQFLRASGIDISSAQVSNLIIKKQNPFHQEKEAIVKAGFASSPWQQIDDTGMRENGTNRACQVVCNSLYSAYFTTAGKSRLTVIQVLQNMRTLTFRLNAEAYTLMAGMKVSEWTRNCLAQLPQDEDIPQERFEELIKEHVPHIGPHQCGHVRDAAAIAAYHAQTEMPVIQMLLCDDAPQFKFITGELALCWIHDGRHYKKLTPYLKYHQELLSDFMSTYWDYYRELLTYRRAPTADERHRLSVRFDEIFNTKTGYDNLDERIAKTLAKKSCLLMVLEHPEIPLHNNESELAVRQRVRKRKISAGTRTEDGSKSWDTFMSLADTARKLGVNIFEYLYDRVSGANRMPSLANLIEKRAAEMSLGASWGMNPAPS